MSYYKANKTSGFILRHYKASPFYKQFNFLRLNTRFAGQVSLLRTGSVVLAMTSNNRNPLCLSQTTKFLFLFLWTLADFKGGMHPVTVHGMNRGKIEWF